MSHTFHATPQDAENAFYEALEHCNLDALMAVWCEDDEVACVHPDGARIAGFAAVRESWARLFAGGARLRARVTQAQHWQSALVAVHHHHEILLAPGEPAPRATSAVTHVFQRGSRGWRLILRHASPLPAGTPLAENGPRLLH